MELGNGMTDHSLLNKGEGAIQKVFPSFQRFDKRNVANRLQRVVLFCSESCTARLGGRMRPLTASRPKFDSRGAMQRGEWRLIWTTVVCLKCHVPYCNMTASSPASSPSERKKNSRDALLLVSRMAAVNMDEVPAQCRKIPRFKVPALEADP